MKKYILIRHNRGNHSASQVYFHGEVLFEGTKKECKAELVRMRKYCKDKYHSTSTNDRLMDYISYEMSDVFFVRKVNDVIEWA